MPQRDPLRFAIRGFEPTQFGNVFGDRIVEGEFAFLHQHQHRGSRNRFDMDAIQKIESTRMKDLCSGSAQPCASIRSTESRVATTVTAPGTSLATITSCMRAEMESRPALVWASPKGNRRKSTEEKGEKTNSHVVDLLS